MEQAEFIAGSRGLSADQQDIVRETLHTLLVSPQFRKSRRYPALLDYAVRNTLDGNLEALKERVLGAEIFGRPADYDTGNDAVVRTAAGEVRKRLESYFKEHPEAPVRITLPVGSYVAEFQFESPLVAEEPPPEPPGSTAVGPLSGTLDTSSSEPQPQTSPGRSPARWIALATLTVLIVGAAALWYTIHLRVPKNFWAPALQNQSPALILLGGGPDPSVAQQGVVAADSKQVVVGNALASVEICDVFHQFNHDCKALQAQTATLDDLRDKTVVLIGAFDNEWTLRLIAPYRFHFQFDAPPSAPPPRPRMIVDGLHPEAKPSWRIGSEGPSPDNGSEYAVIGRFHSEITGGTVVILAGLGPRGTSGAADYASAPAAYSEVLQLAPKDWKGLNFEAVLQIDIVAGTPGRTKILAAQFW